MGEGFTPETQQKILNFVEHDNDVKSLISQLSTYQSPKEVLLMLIIEFQDELNTKDITSAIERLSGNIKVEFPLVKFVIIQPQQLKKV